MAKVLYETNENELETFQGYSESEAWAALRKLWKGFKISKVNNDYVKMADYAKKINIIQKELKYTHNNSDIQLTYFKIESPE